eukprot:scaffold10345_cov144-Skeletonema_menzelii.AAC.4
MHIIIILIASVPPRQAIDYCRPNSENSNVSKKERTALGHGISGLFSQPPVGGAHVGPTTVENQATPVGGPASPLIPLPTTAPAVQD